ncbi:sensor histidine kinase [Baekduia sp. Peel2402]|uniref:sensor histidine kinase n=1 Tax=Baekduia sp. Peel2402 TaxID=3458296 RepID=UPI00403EEA88
MSGEVARESVTADPAWRATALGGTAMVLGLALALTDAVWLRASVAVALAGAVVAAFVLAPRALAAVQRSPSLVIVAALLLAGAAWFLFGAVWPTGSLSRAAGDVARARLWPLLLMAATATGGVVLIADALRVRRGSRWRAITEGSAPFPWSAVVGVLLVCWSAFLGLGLARPYIGDDPARLLMVLVLAGVGVAVVVGTPLLIASFARAREADRTRFAAHLHDSVLQTLALVQRQANDPEAVARLARRQEHALRAWMAGEAELTSATLVGALHEVVDAVEDEAGVAIELTALGDRPLDARGEALVAAAREALRNAARHGGGAPVVVFAQIDGGGAEVFVRDSGPGFVVDDVPAERRGIRDAIVGRMAAVGGRATVESVPGEGTEVALTL